MKNWKNEKVNQLFVEEYAYKKQGNHYWKCKCDCGNIKYLASGNLTDKVKSCGCHRKKGGRSSPSWKGVGELNASFISNLKSQAKFRGLSFDIDVEYAWDLFLKQNRRCALTDLVLNFTEKYREAIHNKGTASLDRIDSNKGYEKGNVQWVHKDVNLMKQDLDTKAFYHFCKKVYLTLRDTYDDPDYVLNEIGIQKRRLAKSKSVEVS